MVKNRGFSNSVFSMFDTLLLPLIMVIVTPFFIDSLGVEKYGVWMFINSIVVALSFINIGGADTVIKYVSLYNRHDDKEKIRQVFTTVFWVQFFTVLFLTIIFIFVFYYYHQLIEYFDFDAEVIPHGNLLLCGVLVFCVKMVEQVVFSYFKGYERYDISSSLSIFSKFSLILTQVGVVYFGGELESVFYASIFISILCLSFSIVILFINDNMLFRKRYFKLEMFKEVFVFTKWAWVLSIVGTASNQIDRWLVGSLTSMTLFGYYSIALLVFNNVHAVFASAVGWVFPKVSYNTEQEDYIYKYYKILQFCLLSASMIVSFALFYSSPLFIWWLGEANYDNSKLYIDSMVVLLPLFSLSIVPYYMIKGFGLIKYNFTTELITFLLRLVLMIVLYSYFGVIGIIIALGVSGLVLALYLVYILGEKVLYNFDLSTTSMFSIPILFLSSLLSTEPMFSVSFFILLIICYVKSFFDVLFKLYRWCGRLI